MAARGEVVVCVPVYGALELVRECLESVVRHTDPSVPIRVADDATPGGGVRELLAGLGREVELIEQPRNVGFVENANALLRAAAPADVVLLNSDCVVGPGWLEGLRAAAGSDTRVATASALADSGTILSVPGADPGAVRAESLRLRPRLPTAVGHCFLIRRAALELVGDFDTAFSPGYGEEVDFSQRCLLHGLIHVVADDVYVKHRAEGSFADAGGLRAAHERLIEQRYPYYLGSVWRAMQPESPLSDALAPARRAARGALSVTIDGSALGPQTMGTQVTTIALARALAARDDVRVRVAVPSGVAPPGLEGVEVVSMEAGERSDVVHRPSQVVAPKNLDWLNRLGERIVITQQDLIAYANPGYFGSFQEWEELRAITRLSLAFADAAVFISEAVQNDALAEELIDGARAAVVPQGVDHGAARPEPVAGLGERPLLVVIGADFRHKNRPFAVALARELGARGFDCTLVLAGPHVEHGSSLAEEERGEGVVQLGEVSEGQKAWLYANAALVLYPTVSEGFGLVPFEAAAAGTPCMFAPVSSLPEVVGAELATIVPWSVGETADRALGLLRDEGEAGRLAEAIAARGREYSWERTAAALVDVYRDVVRRPAQPARAVYFVEGLSDVALALVGPGGQLPPDVQRALLGIAARPGLRRPAFGALRASYRLLSRLRSRR